MLNSSPGQMNRRPDARRRKIDLARSDPGVGDELGNGMDRYCRIDLHDEGPIADACNRRSVSDETEVELIVEHVGDRVSRNHQKERMAVGGRTDDCLGRDIARSPRPVLDDEWLAEALRQPLPNQAREEIGRAAGGKADNDAHRPRRIGLRPCNARDR
jgi:hypothetical protein